MGKIMLLDRSGGETADRCAMAYWHNRIACDGGIVPVDTSPHLEVGRDVHEDLQAIATLEDISAENIGRIVEHGLVEALAGSSELDQVAKEVAYRRFGWAAAFALFIEPRIRELYENESVEGELILDREPLWIPVTPDRVLRSRQTGKRVYREYKSTISSSGKWLGSWRRAPQLHLGMAAIEEDGMEIAYAQVMGLMKGQVRDGRLAHPYVWGYRNTATGKWSHDYQQARGSNWSPAPVWEYPGGLVEWVVNCGADTASQQFPHTEPIFLNRPLVDSYVARWTAQLAQWGTVEELCKHDANARAVFFPQRTGQCEPPFGDPCPYRMACWNAAVNADPLGSGHYVKRVPHHEVEIMLRSRS